MTDRTATIGDNSIASLIQSARDEWSAYDACEADVLKFRAKAAEYTNKANAADDKADEATEKGRSHALRVGEHLIELKTLVKHGEWSAFVVEHFPGRSLRTCQQYMKLAGAPDPEEAEKAAQAADAERKRQEREAERMAEAEAARVREAEENEKRRTAAASGAFALTTIESAQPAPVASQWAAVLPAAPVVEPDREYVPSQEALAARDKHAAEALAAGNIVPGHMPAPEPQERPATVSEESWAEYQARAARAGELVAGALVRGPKHDLKPLAEPQPEPEPWQPHIAQQLKQWQLDTWHKYLAMRPEHRTYFEMMLFDACDAAFSAYEGSGDASQMQGIVHALILAQRFYLAPDEPHKFVAEIMKQLGVTIEQLAAEQSSTE